MNIQLLEAAQQELDEAIEWYAKQAPGAMTDSRYIFYGCLRLFHEG